jgi:hypothetical protein
MLERCALVFHLIYSGICFPFGRNEKKSHKKFKKKKGQTYCRPFSSPNNNKNINSFLLATKPQWD